jgi:hypothetical protein
LATHQRAAAGGTDLAEWLHGATVALVGEIPVERLWEAAPGLSETRLNPLKRLETELTGELCGKTRSAPAG